MVQRSYNTMSMGRGNDLLTKDNANFWERRTKTEQTLIVICSIFAILIVALIIVLIVIAIRQNAPVETNTELPSNVTNEECSSDVCSAAADNLKASINDSINPCEDFYSYVCSGWQRDNPIPANMDSYTTFGVLEERIRNELKDMLANTTFEKSDVRRKMKEFYNSCINNETRESVGVAPLKAILDKLGGWPLLGKNLTGSYSWLESLAYAVRNLSVSPIIVVGVDPDSRNTTRNLIQLDQTLLGLGRNEMLSTNTTDERVQEMITAYKDFIKKSAILLGSKKNENDLDAEIDEMIEFEKALANFTRSEEERRNPISLYNNMTVSELQSALHNKINVTLLLSRIFDNVTEVTGNTIIVVREFYYMCKVSELLNSTKKRTIADYIGWNVVREYSSATNMDFRMALLDFKRVLTGVEEETPLEESCVGTTNDYFDFALGNVFINNQFDIDTKAEIENMIDEMKIAFSELLDNNTWMDGESKERARYKLDEMIPMVAFPSWINDTTELNEYYQELGPIHEDTYFENLMCITKFNIEDDLGKINELNNRSEDWASGPVVVNAFYNPQANTITFPAGILKYPFYQVGLPPAINFGGVGSVIGHEITHGFDDEGSQYDAEGNLHNWWPSAIRKRFQNETKCFVEQYGSVKDPTTGMMLNGENTLGENMGDNGGIRESFKAYKSYTAKQVHNIKLPGLDLTSDQLFFVSYAYVWCANLKPDYLESIIQYNAHNPPRYRVQIPLSNTEEFSQAFNCPANSIMNPEHKCVVW
uniref:Putative Neprilysin 1 n=1 Tax=Megacormus gertschi TaxID=1843536 RepID=A0A224X8D3_9SCOR